MIEQLITIFDEQVVSALSWTILHSLWQGTLIALVMTALLSGIKNNSSKRKYSISIASLVGVFVISTLTFLYYYLPTLTTSTLQEGLINTGQPLILESISIRSTKQLLDANSHFIFFIWLGGVVFFMLKLLVSLGYIQYLKRGRRSESLTSTLYKIKNRLNVTQSVYIFESAKVKIPLVIGFLKPTILFPIGVINNLTTEEVEGIIAHELAHIMRNDYLINIIQTIVEIIFYYHPAIWWISANVKAERENCCDDLALSLGTDPIIYAKSLVKLQELQSTQSPSIAMSFGGSKYQFINRIKRILNMKQTKSNIREKSIAMVCLMTFVLLFSSQLVNGGNENNFDRTNLVPIIHEIDVMRDHSMAVLNPHTSIIDTLPKAKSRVQINTENNGKTMSMTKEDGKITELKIDGKVIPETEYKDYKDMTDDVIFLEDGGNNFMFFENGDSIFPKNFHFDFDGVFDTDKMKEMMNGFEFNNENFVFPNMEGMEDLMKNFDQRNFNFDEEQLEQFEEMMENFGGNMQEFNFDTLIQIGPDDFPKGFNKQHKFFFNDDDDNVFLWDSDQKVHGLKGKKVVDVLGNELNRDGLLEPFKENRVELTGKHLKINGEKQPSNIWGKYKRLYEEHTGMLMSKKARVDFNVEGKKSNRKIRSF